MSAHADLGYGPAPTNARELLRDHRERVDPVPAPATPITARCHVCQRVVGVHHGRLETHDRLVKAGAITMRALCSGTAEAVRG